MKRIISFVLISILLVNTSALNAKNVGVPAESEDVMLQAFYWNSYQNSTKYGRTKWIDLLTDTAAITRDFDLVWFPPSAGPTGNGVGYSARQYSNQDSDWGTKTKLTELISALHKGNTKVIADIVLNHRGNLTSWCNFFTDNFGRYGTYTLTQQHICRNDECFTNSSSSCYNADMKDRGSSDTGDNFDGARDLDHLNEYVQEWSKAYTQWILNSMKYDGFRYDMTLGFHGRYLKMYNEAAQPYISVSELWHSIDRQKQHLQECDSNTMIFDFQQKYLLRDAIINGSYGKLKKNTNSFRGQGLERYAVTFVDNHDTFDRGGAYGDNQFGSNELRTEEAKQRLMQAYAYLMSMPGIPCVFYPHWAVYKDEISRMIALRKRVGIHSESQVLEETSGLYKYGARVQGHRGQVFVTVGKNRSQLDVPEGFEQVMDGDHYTLYVQEGAQSVENVQRGREQGTKVIENGVLYLKYKGATYNVQGMRVE